MRFDEGTHLQQRFAALARIPLMLRLGQRELRWQIARRRADGKADACVGIAVSAVGEAAARVQRRGCERLAVGGATELGEVKLRLEVGTRWRRQRVNGKKLLPHFHVALTRVQPLLPDAQ
eukprot:scaffold36200_cov63-Phaeocystis_antarctica.AAC.8